MLLWNVRINRRNIGIVRVFLLHLSKEVCDEKEYGKC